MKKFKFSVVLLVAMFAAVSAFGQSLAVDRGLPTANLNNAAGANRSNVAWAFDPAWLTGDDFLIGSSGEKYLITKLRGWSTQGAPGGIELGDRFQSVTLYGGPLDSTHFPLMSGNYTFGTAIAPLMTGTLSTGSSANSNSNISHSRTQYVGGADYQGSSGSFIQVWQHDFNLAWVVDGGTRYAFAGDGELRTGVSYYWFNHASNAALSGSSQQGSDGLYFAWEKLSPNWLFVCDSGALTCGGWDKSSDLNVQIWAKKIATNANTCKNNGWRTLFRVDGTGFRNQGDCIQYVNTGR